MSVLRLWTLASLLGCCVGYVLVRRPAEYYEYYYRQMQEQLKGQLSTYQWQPSTYQPYNYYPRYYDYSPSYYDYSPSYYDYYPSYYNSYNYYNPLSYGYQEPHKADHNPRPSHDEGQKLLKLYRLIRVIELFRLPPNPKKLTSLDRLVQRLTNAHLQEQLVELVYHVYGYEEVAKLERGPNKIEAGLFVNDIGRLLTAIQRALNALDLDDHDRYNHQDHYDRYDYNYRPGYSSYGYTRLPEKLRHELRQLRDQANSLTVAQIERELKKGHYLSPHAKEALESDVLESLVDERESKSLVDESNENYDVVVKGEDDEGYVLVIDDPEEPQKSRDHRLDQETLDDLAAALELYLEKQKASKAHLVREKSQEETLKSLPVATTTTPAPPIPKEDAKGSWLGSLLGKSQPESKNNKLDEQEKWIHEDVVDKNSLDFDIDPRLHASTTTERTILVSSVTHSVPLWQTKDPELQKVENKESRIEFLNRVEAELLRDHPETKQEPEDLAEDASEAADEEARQLPDDELPDELVEGEVDGPARFDLPTVLTRP